MLAREHPEAWRSYLTDGVIEGLEAAMTDVRTDAALRTIAEGLGPDEVHDVDLEDEEPCLPEPGEEDDPDQLYDPLPGFGGYL
jgi:hypothetical protein